MISIILPTYNEAANLDELFERINSVIEQEYEILVVDDDSPDGTAQKAKNLSENYPVNVISRKENHGLSQSVIEGFKNAKGDLIIVMDADLQHPPEVIPKLLEKVESTNIVVASRFLNQKNVKHWSKFRKATNKVASLISKIVLWNKQISDPMSGFFAFKKGSVNIEELDAEGFKILLDIIHRNELEIKEVPYQFNERKRGESSFNFAAIIDYLEQMAKIFLEKLGFKQSKRIVQLMEFMAVGGTGVFVNSFIFILAAYYGIHFALAGALAFLGALHWNFFWNKLVTFSKSEKSFRHQYFYFFLVNLGGFIIYEALLFILIGYMNLWKPAANIAAIFGGFIWNFFGSEKIAFK